MNDALYIAVELLIIGMTTVFLILGLVVLGGRLMIIIVNKIAPEAARNGSSSGIKAPTLAAITAAVQTTTQGKGRITHIKRVD